IVVVDNGNPPAEQAWMDEFSAASDKVHIVRDGTNPGFGAGVNKGASGALGKLLLVINPDAVLRRGSLARLVGAMSKRAEPVLVGGKIFDVHGREERGARRNTLTLMRAIGFGKWTLEDEPPPRESIEVGAVSGAFFLMERQAFRRMGGFDEGYFLHVEDVDLCRRVQEAGGTVVYQPHAGALHYGSTSDISSEAVIEHKARSLVRYFRKFSSGPLESLVISLISPLMVRALKARR
ncbi:MAG: glycosyltransferase family 2 protein, partial [Hyphomonas sp.]|nr:glycosyltransferase family 2 protein [Hyphomonas sp.]